MRVTIKAEGRSPASKGAIRQMRQSGLVPVSVSGRGAETIQLTVPARELADTLHRYGASALVQLTGANVNTLAIARDIQRHPVTGKLLHVGFRSVSEKEPVTAEVALRLVGEPEAVRTGTAVLEQATTAVQVRALPDRLPTHVDVDSSNMELGDVLHVSDIPTSPDYEVVTDPETVIASVHTVRAAVTPQEEEEVTTEEEGTEAAEAAKEG